MHEQPPGCNSEAQVKNLDKYCWDIKLIITILNYLYDLFLTFKCRIKYSISSLGYLLQS